MKKKSLLLTLLLALLVPWAAAQSLFSEDFEDGSMPTGWTTDGPGSWSVGTGDYSSGTGAGHGSYNAKITHSTSSSVTKLITPEIDLSSATSAELSFMHVQRSWSGDIDQLRVYYRTSSSGAWTLLDGQTYTGAVASWTTEENIALPNISSTYQIAFEMTDKYGYGVGIDYVQIVQGASCVKPTGLAATLTPGDGTIATLNWTAGGTETNWVLEYGTTSDFTGATSVNVSGTPTKNLTGLTPETKHYARVKAVCSGTDQSNWSATCEFTPTDQLIISILGTTGSTSSHLPSNTNYDFAYTQQIYTAEEMGSFPCTLKSVAFKGNNAAVCDLDIYLANTTKSSFTGTSDYIAISEATLVFSGEVTFIANDWKTITFANEFDYTGGNLAVIVDDNSDNYTYGTTTWQTFNTTTAQALYFYQDDTNINPSSPSVSYSYNCGTPTLKDQIKFVYELPSPYVKPQNLAVTNLTATTATITWEAPNSDVQSYKYQYREAGGSWSALTSTTALSAPLTVLTGNTTYEFQVQAIYAGNNESAFASTTFTTLIAIPYVYGFEDAAEFNKWETVDCEYDDSNYLSGVVTYSAYAHTDDNFFAFSSYNGATDPQYLISPALSGIVNGLHVSFYYRSANENDPETFMVGYSTTDKDPDSFTWSTEVTSPDNNYYPYAVNFMVPAIKYVAVKYTSGDSYYLFVDDFTFEEAPNCLEPTGVNAINITTTTADITWTNGGDEDEWDIYATDDINDVPNDLTTPTVEGITTKPYTLPLLPGTTYYVYVRAACSAKEHSAWSSPCSFHTDCEGMDLPYGPYGFEDGALTVCWNLLSTNVAYNTVSMNTTASYIHTGDYSLLMHSGSADGDFVLALPVIDDSYSLSDYRFVFWAMATNTDLKVTIGIMEDPNDMTTFVAQSEEFNPASTFTEYKVPFNGYSGDGHYVALKVSRASSGSSYGNIYFDDIAIELLPSCIEPSGLTVSDEAPHGATFSWTNGGSETEWHLYFGKNNTAPADDIDLSKVTVANSNPFTMTTGLDPETDYYVWVRANCGSTDGYSEWVGPKTFTTTVACPAPTGLTASEVTNHTAKLSWTGTSDSYNVWYRTAEYNDGSIVDEDFTGLTSGIPTGWDNSEGTMTTNSYKWNYYATGHEGVGLRFDSYNATSGQTNFLKTPSMDFPAGKTMQLSFWWKNPKGGDFSVYISTDGGTTKTPIVEGLTSQSTWKQETFNLTDYIGANNVTIHFKGTSNWGSGDAYIYLDEVQIGEAVPAGTWTTKTTDASPYVATGLLAETKYEAQVQGNCGSEGTSQWSSSIFFTTDIACPAPSSLTPSNPTSVSFDLSWNNGGAEDWVLAYKVDGAADFTELDLNVSDVTEEAGTISYTLGGLEAETDYIVKVRDNCEASYAGDGVSEWTAEVPYSTIAACSALNPVVSGITHYNATVNWEGESATGFTVNYRTAEGINGTTESFDGTSTPTGWEVKTGLLSDIMEGSELTASAYPNWVFTTANGVFNNHTKLNIFGNKCKSWLISPEIEVGTGYSLNFDLALTDYNGSTPAIHTGTCDDDRFLVLVFVDNAWEILREWNNSGSTYVYNDISYSDTGENVNLSLSAYNNKTVKIAFYGESTTSGNGDNNLHIDNVTIGANVPAGAWQTEPAATTTANLTGLTAGTKYDLKVVPNCDETLESATVQFTTLVGNMKYFLTAGEWGTASNWMDEEIPAITDNATIRANVTIAKNYVAYAQNITRENSATITIQDGGELYHSNAVYSATMEKEITGATTWGLNQGASDGWYVISNPLSTSFTPTNTTYVTDLAPAAVASVPQFDLYKYSESNMNWYSYNAHQSSYYLTRGMGFLYSRNEDATISFMSGTSYSLPVADVTPTITYTDANGDMAGWNLLGNPFSHSITWANIEATNVNTDGYFKLGFDGAWTANPSTTAEIKPMEGFLVKATAASPTLTIKNVAASSKGRANNDFLAFTVANSNYSDITYAMFSDGEGLEKINHRNTNVPMVYIPQDGERYAIATMGDETDMFNLNFKAMTTGKYTLSYKAEGSYDYLHVIDRITGEDVDMLIDGEYSFMASAGDNENRFIVKLRYNANGNFENDIFAYQNGDDIIVNGKGELQIFDVMGRFVTSMQVNGSERISAEQYSNAVYIFRLVGNDVKTQKIVVR